MKVVNVEVPVRVFHKGEPVADLTKEDFQLFEGKKPQAISSFKVVKNRVNETSTGARYLVLVFRVSDYNKQFKEGVKYLFDQVLTEHDQLLVFVNSRSLTINDLKDKAAVHRQLDQLLKEQGQLARGNMAAYFKRIEQEVEISRFRVMLRSQQDPFRFVQDFLKKYMRVWKEYKTNYLIPDIDSFYYFAKHLEGIKKEKWVINFYQMDMFPDIALTGQVRREIKNMIGQYLSSTDSTQISYGRILQNLVNEIDRALTVSEDFPTSDISKLFYKADAVFHSLFMRSHFGAVSKDLQYRSVSTDIENIFREITKLTGGTLVVSDNLVEALETIGKKENVCYLLTYAPPDPQQIGKIEVKTSNKKYTVRYDDNMRADYITAYLEHKKAQEQPKPKPQAKTPDIVVKDLSFKKKKLVVSVSDFLIKNTTKGMMGSVGIHICIKNSSGQKIFDQGKPLGTKKDLITISIPFPQMTPGEYDITIDVKDFFTGKTAQDSLHTRVK